MYDRDAIFSCGSGLVGWNQSADPNHTTLSADLLISTSGYHYDDLPGIDFNIIEGVLSSVYTDINAYLRRVHESQLIRLVDRVVQKSKDQLRTKELLANFDPITGKADFTDLVTQSARFVGFMIMPHRSNNLRAEITYLGMQLDTIQTNPVRLYLYETSQQDAIATFDYQNTLANSLEWQRMINFIINYTDITGGTAQTYLLGYYETDAANPQTTQLEGQALYIDLCSGCTQEALRKNLYQRYIGIIPIELPNSMLNWNVTDYDLPDTTSLENYRTDRTHGLLLKLNITCDISYVICSNIQMFAESLQYAVGIKILGDALTSVSHKAVTDASQNRDQWKNWMLKYEAELRGYQLESGIWHKGMVDTLVLDLSNIDDFCLKCKQTAPILGRIDRIETDNPGTTVFIE